MADRVITDVRTIELPRHTRADGEVVVAEAAAHVPFAIERIFTITAPKGAERGNHAHKLCSQFMLCVSGAVDVVCDDGREKRTQTLDRGSLALLVPPMIWNTVIFRADASVLAVLCDRLYEAHDYISDYAAFMALRDSSPP